MQINMHFVLFLLHYNNNNKQVLTTQSQRVCLCLMDNGWTAVTRWISLSWKSASGLRTLKTFSTMSTHMINIFVKFH